MAPQCNSNALTRRAQFLALGFAAFFVVTWLSVFYPFEDLVDRFGAPLGGDFPMFYVAGQTVADGAPHELYDDGAQQARLHQLLPAIAADYTLPYRYPPLVAWLFAPLAKLSYPLAFALFASAMLALWWSSAWLLGKQIATVDRSVAAAGLWLMMGWPVGWEAIIGGQASPMALIIVAAVWCLLRAQRDGLAGAVLALAVYKPNVLALFLLGCLLARPRMLAGAAIVWLTLVALTWMAVGWDGITDYLAYGSRLALEAWGQETPYWKVQGLGSVLAPLLGGYERIFLLSIGLVLTAAIAWRWRRDDRLERSAECAAALLVVNFLCNPYVPIYDVLTLMAAAAIAAQALDDRQLRSAVQGRLAQTAVLLLVAGPHLSQALARMIGVQIFPLAILVFALCWAIHRIRILHRGQALSRC